jgi:hypothetical protein
VYGDHSVSYLHRTARDFIESENYWPTVLQNTGRASFKPEERWANEHLWLYKTVPFLDPDHLLLRRCITDARILQKKTGLIQKTYLDEVCRAVYVHGYREGFDQGQLYTTLITFMKLSDEPFKTEYLSLVLASATPEEVGHALKYADLVHEAIIGSVSNLLQYYRTSRSW